MYKIFNYAIVVLLILPTSIVLYLSLHNNGVEHIFSFTAYYSLLENEKLLNAFLQSIQLALPVALISTTIAFFLGLNFWNKKRMLIIVSFMLLLYFSPGEVYSISILNIYKMMGGVSSSISLLIFSHISYVLPYSLAVILLGNFKISEVLIFSNYDLGVNKFYLIYKVIFQLTWSMVLSSFLISFLFSFNEYTRTSYLSGSTNYFSEYVYGKLNSGVDERIYALSIISILVVVLLLTIILYRYFKKSKQ